MEAKASRANRTRINTPSTYEYSEQRGHINRAKAFGLELQAYAQVLAEEVKSPATLNRIKRLGSGLQEEIGPVADFFNKWISNLELAERRGLHSWSRELLLERRNEHLRRAGEIDEVLARRDLFEKKAVI